MTIEACLIIHPYTALKDTGAGHDRYAYELKTRLPSHGVNCELFESGPLSNISQALIAEGKAIWRLAWMKEKSLFHATATANAQAPITARKRPLITTIHDVLWFKVKDKYDSKLKYLLKTKAIRRAAEKSDGIIVPFKSTLEFLVNQLKVDGKRIHIVPYGVDHEQLYPLKSGEELPRPDFFPKKGKIVLFVGAVNLAKGVDTLILSFEAVVSKAPDAQLVIGSSGWDVDIIKKIREESRVRDQIHFTGFIPENQLRAAYIHADVTVFPSRYGFGLATLESMACGTPTVSGRTLDAPEFVADAGLMADPERPEEIAEQIIRILSDDGLHTELKIKGLEKSSDFGWEQTAKKTADVYMNYI